MNLISHILRLRKIWSAARARSSTMRLERELISSGLHIQQHRNGLRCKDLGRVLKARRQAVHQMLRQELAS